jgi:hypothetical protein
MRRYNHKYNLPYDRCKWEVDSSTVHELNGCLLGFGANIGRIEAHHRTPLVAFPYLWLSIHSHGYRLAAPLPMGVSTLPAIHQPSPETHTLHRVPEATSIQ